MLVPSTNSAAIPLSDPVSAGKIPLPENRFSCIFSVDSYGNTATARTFWMLEYVIFRCRQGDSGPLEWRAPSIAAIQTSNASRNSAKL